MFLYSSYDNSNGNSSTELHGRKINESIREFHQKKKIQNIETHIYRQICSALRTDGIIYGANSFISTEKKKQN